MTPLVTRPEWGGAPFSVDRIGRVDTVFIHHSVTNAFSPLAATMQMLEAHARALGHRAIDYSFCHFVSGERAEGRGWWAAGGHTINNNSTSYGLCGIGNFVNDAITDALLDAFAQTISEGIALGAITPNPAIRPHSDVFATACPGYLREAIPQIRSRIGQPSAPQADLSGDNDVYLYKATDTAEFYLVHPYAKKIAVGVSPGQYQEFAKCGVKGNGEGKKLQLVAQVKTHLIAQGRPFTADDIAKAIK